MVSPERGFAYGLVQGATEFLPVSSSAHLFLLPWFFGWEDPGLGFTVALHAGTLLAIAWYFWREWWQLAAGTLGSFRSGAVAANGEAKLFWRLVVGSLPAVVIGLAFEDVAETAFRSPWLIAGTLSVLGVLLYVSDRAPERKRGVGEIGWTEALIIGFAQALAIVPGVSRSGATITAARLMTLDRESAARFSFLLSGPIVFGALLLEYESLLAMRSTGDLVAFAASALSGFAAIGGLLRYVRVRSYLPFVLYRFVLSALIVAAAL